MRNVSLLREPLGPVFDRNSLFADFTATSARPFDWGLYADDTRGLTPHFLRKSFVRLAVNSGPLDSSSGTPNVSERERKQAIKTDQALPVGVEKISNQPDSRSPATR